MYTVTARNFLEESENKIHSDDIAQKFGFTGALVPGVAVWGHVTYPFVAKHGQEWLTSGHASVRFHKPAYHQDRLSLKLVQSAGNEYVYCKNAEGVLLASAVSPPEKSDLEQPSDDTTTSADNAGSISEKSADRVEMTWDTVVEGQSFAPWDCELRSSENLRYTEEILDELPLYQSGVVHPHWLLALANRALTRDYVMPAWLHVGSEIRFHRLLLAGHTITLHPRVEAKWEDKGHQFVRVYIAFRRNNELTTEISHTAIFRVAS